MGLWLWGGRPQRLGAHILLRDHGIIMTHHWCCSTWVPIHSLLLPTVFHCLEIPCFINLSAHGHLMYFHFLAIGNHATVNIYVPIFVWTHIFHSCGYLLGGGITGSYSYSVLNVLRNFQNLCSVHSILHPPSQQCLRVQFPHILISTYCFLSFG